MLGALDLRKVFTFASDSEGTLVREQAFSVDLDSIGSNTIRIQDRPSFYFRCSVDEI